MKIMIIMMVTMAEIVSLGDAEKHNSKNRWRQNSNKMMMIIFTMKKCMQFTMYQPLRSGSLLIIKSSLMLALWIF
jgi:hypothetical protein